MYYFEVKLAACSLFSRYLYINTALNMYKDQDKQVKKKASIHVAIAIIKIEFIMFFFGVEKLIISSFLCACFNLSNFRYLVVLFFEAFS